MLVIGTRHSLAYRLPVLVTIALTPGRDVSNEKGPANSQAPQLLGSLITPLGAYIAAGV